MYVIIHMEDKDVEYMEDLIRIGSTSWLKVKDTPDAGRYQSCRFALCQLFEKMYKEQKNQNGR